jgi:hypothetical protein
MYLTVPARLVAGRPATLRVTGSSSGSRRWFGLYDYTDTIEHERAVGGLLPDVEAAALVNGFAKLVQWTSAEATSVADVARLRGTTEMLPQFVANSRKLQALCRKLNMEAARRSPEIDGYTLWLLQDYWKGGQGLLNQFYEPKGVSAEECRQRNGETAVLLDYDRCALSAGETMGGTVVVSHFGERRLPRPRLEVALRKLAPDGALGATIHESERELGAIRAGTVADVGGIAIVAPEAAAPARYRLRLRLHDRDASWANQWDFTVFPPPTALERPERVGVVGGERFAGVLPGARQLKPTAALPEDVELLVAGALTRRLFERMRSGQRVLLLSRGAFGGDRLRFKSPWWFPGPRDSNLGTIVTEHPALGGFPHDGWCDLPWFELVEGAQAVHHVGPLAGVAPIIQSIDLPLRQLPRSLLLEAQIGEGRLLSCSLNMTADVIRESPAARYLLGCLVRYALSDEFRPAARLTPDELSAAVAWRELLDSTCLEGFAGVVAVAPDPHSGQTEGRPAEELGPRGEAVRTWIARQRDGTRFVTWQTEPAPAAVATETVTFCWSGKLGWIDEPEGRFELAIAGRPVVAFGVVRDAHTWSSDDGAMSLRFEPRVTHGSDTAGVFWLKLPTALVTPGEPLELTVRGSGGSRRWFGLCEYSDSLSRELSLQ